MKREIAIGLLVVMLGGLITNGLAMWQDVAVIKTRLDSSDATVDGLQEKIDDIHWFLIESKGVKIKRERKHARD